MSETLDIDAIEKCAAEASPGPWMASAWGDWFPGQEDENLARSVSVGDEEHVLVGGGNAVMDAIFIAASRTDVPALCARVRALEEDRDRFHAELAAQVGENEQELARYSRLVSERDALRVAADRVAAHFEALLAQVHRCDGYCPLHAALAAYRAVRAGLIIGGPAVDQKEPVV